MARGIAAAALIAAVVVGAGMAAPAFAKHGNGNGGGGGFSNGSNPPGWSHGNKTGWGGRDMPPGLYKKNHSDTSRSYSNRYSGSSSYGRNYWNYYGSPWRYYGS